MLRIGLYVGDTIAGETLGVARYALGIASGLAQDPSVDLTIIGVDEAVGSYHAAAPGSRTTTLDRLPKRLDVIVKIHQLQVEQFDISTVNVFHDLHPVDVPWKYGRGLQGILDRIERNFAAADLVVSEFPFTVDRLQERYPDDGDKVVLIPSPTLLDIEAAMGDAEPLADLPDVFALYPSQFQLHKNHWTLLSALRKVRAEGHELELVFSGSTMRPFMRQRIEDRVQQLGLADVVHFVGHVSEAQLVQLYRASAVIISPSLAEGGAYLAQEALATNRPVTLSNLPAAAAHLQLMGLDVPLFDPYDADAMAAAIAAALKGHSSENPATVAAAERVSSWTWEEVGRELVAAITALKTNRGPTAVAPRAAN